MMIDARPRGFAEAPVASNDWNAQTLPRLDGPPLRFKGRRLSFHEAAEGIPAFVALWARKKGDYAVSFSWLHERAIKVDSIVCPSFAAAADHLEALCSTFSDSDFNAAMDSTPLRELILRMGFEKSFSDLVGRALADWDEALLIPAAG